MSDAKTPKSGPIKIEWVPIGDLIENPDNPRYNDNAVDAVAKSIQAYGFNNPIVTDAKLMIAAGHTRLKAARKLGLETVPVVRVADLDGARFEGFSIADNQTGSLAEWDLGKLSEIVKRLSAEDIDVDSDFDISTLGFDDLRLDGLLVEGSDLGDALAALPDEDRSNFEQMTFVVTHAQAAEIKGALRVAKNNAPDEDGGNRNSNGIALTAIARAYVL